MVLNLYRLLFFYTFPLPSPSFSASQSSLLITSSPSSLPPLSPSLSLSPVLPLPLPTGVLTLLKFPYPREVAEPECYDNIRVHAEWGQPQANQEDSKPIFSVSYTRSETPSLVPSLLLTAGAHERLGTGIP